MGIKTLLARYPRTLAVFAGVAIVVAAMNFFTFIHWMVENLGEQAAYAVFFGVPLAIFLARSFYLDRRDLRKAEGGK